MPAFFARRAIVFRGAPGRLRWGGLLMLWLSTAPACRDRAPVPHRPLPGRGVAPTSTASGTAQPASVGVTPALSTSMLAPRREPADWDPGQGQPSTDDQAQDSEAGARPRDLGAELRSLLGSPASCLTPRPYQPSLTTVTIQISAQVMQSGVLGRVEARSPSLTPEEQHCVERLVSPIRLRGPIEGAPRGIQTQVALQPKAAAKPQPEAAAPTEPRDDDDARGPQEPDNQAAQVVEPALEPEPADRPDTADSVTDIGADEQP